MTMRSIAMVCLALAAGQTIGHAQHQHDADTKRSTGEYSIRKADYAAPPVQLVDQGGRTVRVDELLQGDRPVLLQFIFTTCATICPVMGATFSSAQADLVAAHPDTLLVSISIDPEYDTPTRMQAFGQRLRAGKQWRFLTGDAGDIRRTMKAFDVLYAGDNKMYHQFNTFLRVPGKKGWLRMNGMPGAGALVAEYRTLLGNR